MAISSEFAKTVQEKNVLRTRIMLKDSLLVDKSFSKYKELLTYAEAQGVEVWMTQEDPIEPAKKPWTLDLMNYELTALVNDFTEAHVQYVQKIITEVYKGEASVSAPVSSNQDTPLAEDKKLRANNTNNDDYNSIIYHVNEMIRILKNNKDSKGNRCWFLEDIKKIRKSSGSITIACENILRRK